MVEGRKFGRAKGIALGLGLAAAGVGAHEAYKNVAEQAEKDEKNKEGKELADRIAEIRSDLQAANDSQKLKGNEKKAYIIQLCERSMGTIELANLKLEQGLVKSDWGKIIIDNLEVIFKLANPVVDSEDWGQRHGSALELWDSAQEELKNNVSRRNFLEKQTKQNVE